MKKFLASILAVCLLCSSGIFGVGTYADIGKVEAAVIPNESQIYNDNNRDEVFGVVPHAVLNQETGCYDVDIYVVTANGYFSNFEAEIRIHFADTEIKNPKLSIEQFAKGSFTAAITKDMLNIVFNATKNVDMSAGYVVNDMNGYENIYIFKIATVKTDIKQNIRKNGSEDGSGTEIDRGIDIGGGEVKTAGFINGNKVINFGFTDVGKDSDAPALPGDYDFDGALTVKDLIAAQYYLTNRVDLRCEFLMRMLNSTSLQYLQMYLCETISFSEYFKSVYGEAGMIDEKWYECDKYWDSEYWGNEEFPTDEQGYKYLGEDRYGNYHVWNEKQGVKFFVKMGGSEFGVHFYKIDENGEIKNSYNYYETFFGDEMFYMGSEQLLQFRCENPYGRLWLEYWNETWLEKQDSDSGVSSENYEYKGIDSYGSKYYWKKTNGFKFFTHYGSAYRYLISPKDNKLLIVGYTDKWWEE